MPKMIKVEVSKLTGIALDWAVFKAVNGLMEALRVVSFTPDDPFPKARWLEYTGAYGDVIPWRPSSDWSQGGPLIQEHGIGFYEISKDEWRAGTELTGGDDCGIYMDDGMYGDTPLVASCRSIVASVFGNSVTVPEDLIEVRA